MLSLLAQLTPGGDSPAGDARRAAEAIRARPEAEIAVFPECFLGGYRLKNPRGRPPASLLDTINASSWTQTFNDELLTLLNALGRLVRLEPRRQPARYGRHLRHLLDEPAAEPAA